MNHDARAVLAVSATTFLLFGVIPDEWLSILTEPEGRVFAKSEEEDCAIRELEAAQRQIAVALARVRAKAGAA